MVKHDAEDYISALLGGILIGLATTLNFATYGRITGNSGIFNTLIKLKPKDGLKWKFSFFAGIIAAGHLLYISTDKGKWETDSFTIYFFDPIRKTTLSASVIHSSVRQDERNYNWGPPGFYQEITGTSGDTVLGSLSFGSEIFDRFRLNVSITTSIYEEEVEGVDEKAIGDQYSFGFSYRFGD